METTATYDKKPWLNQYENGVPNEISFEKDLLPDFLERSAKRFPDNSALNFEGCRITYKELNSMVDRFSAHLYSFGIRKGIRSIEGRKKHDTKGVNVLLFRKTCKIQITHQSGVQRKSA